MANRVCFLVDGFNVYHSIIEALKAHPADSMKWLDFQAFCTSFLPLISNDATLEKVFYFSASADFRPDKAARHAVLVGSSCDWGGGTAWSIQGEGCLVSHL